MTKLLVILASIFVYVMTQGSADIKYASSEEIEKMQQRAISSLTPLMEAIIEKDILRIERLIKNKGQDHNKDKSSETDSWWPFVRMSLDILSDWWYKNNAWIDAQDNSGQTALMWAVIHDLPLYAILLLLSVKNININLKDNDGFTALDHAIMKQKPDIVQALLNVCAQDGICPLVNQRDNKLQFTSLTRAAIDGNSQVIKLLLQAGANPTAVITQWGKKVPVSELYNDDDKEITNLMKEKAENYRARAHEVVKAIKHQDLNKAKKLINLGIDVNANFGEPLYWAIRKDCLDLVELLLNNKADVNRKIQGDWSMLHFALDNKNIAKLLLNNKADVNAENVIGYTPLHSLAADKKMDEDKKAIAQMLIDNKADVNAKNKDGQTPLDLAIKKEIFELLRKAGAK